MIVPIQNIITLIKEKVADVYFMPIADVGFTPEGRDFVRMWDAGIEIPHKEIPALKKEGVKEINLKFSNLLYKSLTYHCPEYFKNPSAILTFMQIDKIITTYEKINRISKRKRYISFMYELYGSEGYLEEPVVKFAEQMDVTKWNFIKRKIKKDAQLPILYSEIGIIVLVDLTQKTDENYIERFKKNTDLCTTLAQRKADNSNFIFSPEFNTITDIWAVNDTDELLDTYIKSNAKLIILGDKINERYKAALLEIKKYDRFARFIITTSIDANDCNSLLAGVKKAYNKDNYAIE